MTRVGELRKGLKDRLGTVNGLTPYATMPANPTGPSAAVSRGRRVPLSFDGDSLYRFRVWVVVGDQDTARSQSHIDEFLSDEGPRSIEAAIELDPSLGGVAQYAVVVSVEEDVPVETGTESRLRGAAIEVEVYA